MTALEESGFDEETIILLTSDHWAEPGTHNHGYFHDQNLFVLWTVKGPGVKKNSKIQKNVHNIDSMPTVLDLLGLDKYSNQWRGKLVIEWKKKRHSWNK